MEEGYRPPTTEEDRLKAGLAVHMAAARTGGRPDRIFEGGRLDPRTSKTRWLAMYLSHIVFGWPLERVADVFGLNRSTAAAACRWVEDARDDPALDDLLGQLEGCIHALYRVPSCELAR